MYEGSNQMGVHVRLWVRCEHRCNPPMPQPVRWSSTDPFTACACASWQALACLSLTAQTSIGMRPTKPHAVLGCLVNRRLCLQRATVLPALQLLARNEVHARMLRPHGICCCPDARSLRHRMRSFKVSGSCSCV
jgi:hypothetical protein